MVLRRDVDCGVHQRPADATPLVGWKHGHWTNHPYPPHEQSLVRDEVAFAQQKVTDDSAGHFGYERAAGDPTVGSADVVDDIRFERLTEGGQIDGTNRRLIAVTFAADDHRFGRHDGVDYWAGTDSPF